MKKVISILLICSILTVACSGFSAAVTADELTDYPVILVPGYSSSQLRCPLGDGEYEYVWGINTDLVLERVLANIVQLGKGLGELTVGDAEYLAKILGEEMKVMLEKMRCNDDGSSVYPIERRFVTAEESNTYNLEQKYPDAVYSFETDIMGEAAKYIGKKNIYNFNCDFRMGAEFCAGQLDEFIQSVKEYSGKDKVNIYAVSHGGQVSATYLALYGYKGDVDNAVLTIPAIGGAGLAYDLLSNTAKLDEELLLRFIEHGMRWEEDYDWLLKAQQCGFLDNFIYELVPYVLEIVGNWGSLWDFVPAEKYEETKALLLDETLNAGIIEKSDRFHYDILPTMGEKLQECIDNGMNISIIAGAGNGVVSGYSEYSDAIIPVNSSTGATTAPLNERFADGYTQINPCDGKNKVSPNMEVDASTAYLPDNTWIVDNLYHGMTYWDPYTKELLYTLMLTDRITDVYSDENFPQFHDTTNPSHAVYAEFNGADAGFITGESDTLKVKNICQSGSIRVTAVNIAGAELRVNLWGAKTLAPGEELELELKGSVPQISKKLVTVTVSYVIEGNATPVGERIQGFTVMNGAAAAYSGLTSGSLVVTPEDNSLFSPISLGSYPEALRVFFAMLQKILVYWVQTIFA